MSLKSVAFLCGVLLANPVHSGEVKMSLADGEILARVTIAPKCLSGIVQFQG